MGAEKRTLVEIEGVGRDERVEPVRVARREHVLPAAEEYHFGATRRQDDPDAAAKVLRQHPNGGLRRRRHAHEE